MQLEVIYAIGAVAAWLLLAWHFMFRPSARVRPGNKPGNNTAPASDPRIAVVYASQTGTAIDIARRTAEAFGDRAVLLPMDDLTPALLARHRQALFVVSTYGEGDPPDMAQPFHMQMMQPATDNPSLRGMEAGILALGDSSYRNFCGFGLALEGWLKERGAALMFDTLLADRADPATLSLWSGQLLRLFQVHLDAAGTPYSSWTLAQRTILNPSGLGQPCHELLWQPVPEQPSLEQPVQKHPALSQTVSKHATEPANLDWEPGDLNWEPGDIAQIRIGDSGEHREYSIASIPSEGTLRLLVREHHGPDGFRGLGSHWLCTELAVGATAQLRIRSNPLFRLPEDDRPCVFIGNGTGIAGLRALLQERMQRGHHDNWLIFGERSRQGDFHWSELLQTWLQQGGLSRLDLAFSRDQPEKRYVHHLLRESAPQTQAWAARGAVFFVCGSKDGMAHDVDHALRDILGPHGYQALLQRQGYRRDVY